jgi:hypothetical protein
MFLAILLFIAAFGVAFVCFFCMFFVGFAWWGLIVSVTTASGGIVPMVLGLVYLLVFGLPQWIFPGTWVAEKFHNGASHLTDFILFLLFLPFHAFGYAIDLFRYIAY